MIITSNIDVIISNFLCRLQYWERQESGRISFSCQNGPEECVGNMVHACSIKYINDEHKLADYIHCMIEDNYDPTEIGRMVIMHTLHNFFTRMDISRCATMVYYCVGASKRRPIRVFW